MNKISLFLIGLLVVSVFMVGCEEGMPEEELNEALAGMSIEQLDEVITESAELEKAAMAGQAIKGKTVKTIPIPSKATASNVKKKAMTAKEVRTSLKGKLITELDKIISDAKKKKDTLTQKIAEKIRESLLIKITVLKAAHDEEGEPVADMVYAVKTKVNQLTPELLSDEAGSYQFVYFWGPDTHHFLAEAVFREGFEPPEQFNTITLIGPNALLYQMGDKMGSNLGLRDINDIPFISNLEVGEWERIATIGELPGVTFRGSDIVVREEFTGRFGSGPEQFRGMAPTDLSGGFGGLARGLSVNDVSLGVWQSKGQPCEERLAQFGISERNNYGLLSGLSIRDTMVMTGGVTPEGYTPASGVIEPDYYGPGAIGDVRGTFQIDGYGRQIFVTESGQRWVRTQRDNVDRWQVVTSAGTVASWDATESTYSIKLEEPPIDVPEAPPEIPPLEEPPEIPPVEVANEVAKPAKPCSEKDVNCNVGQAYCSNPATGAGEGSGACGVSGTIVNKYTIMFGSGGEPVVIQGEVDPQRNPEAVGLRRARGSVEDLQRDLIAVEGMIGGVFCRTPFHMETSACNTRSGLDGSQGNFGECGTTGHNGGEGVMSMVGLGAGVIDERGIEGERRGEGSVGIDLPFVGEGTAPTISGR